MKVKYLVLAISAALSNSAFSTEPVQTETTVAEEKIEVIKVSGILSSLKHAQSIKKHSDNVVDALVAVDIGQFPDENVAEALQRIPGISVTRNNGEGQTITIRGLTGKYNITTFNGRKLATDNADRDFNYDVIASELVGKVEVHKTQQARLQEGSIGGIVDIATRKPLEFGQAMSMSVEADYNERSKSTNPKLSFIAGNVYNEGTFGALVSLVHTETTSRYDSYYSQKWHDYNYSEIEGDVIPAGGQASDIFRRSDFPKITMDRSERERSGGTLALQWLPSDNLNVNFDVLYSTYNIESSGKVLSLALPNVYGPLGEFTEFVVGDDGFLDSATWNDATLELLETSSPRKSKTYQVGLNVDWVLDELSFNFDVSHSAAKNEDNGDSNFVVVRAGVDAASINFANGQAIPDISLSQPLDENVDYGAHYSRKFGDTINDETSRVVLDGIYEPTDGRLSALYFGAGYNAQEKDKANYWPKVPAIFAQDRMDDVNPTYDAETVFIGGQELWLLPQDVIVAGNGDNFGGHANVPSSWPSINTDALYNFYQKLDPAAYQQVIPSLTKDGGESYTVKEETIHAYVEAKFEDELLGLPYMVDIGLRYVKTDVSSSGYSHSPANLQFTPEGELANDNWNTRSLVTYDGSYADFLPSLNIKVNLTDDVVVRFAASEAIARPALSELRPNTTIKADLGENTDGKSKRTIEESDPGLTPYTAKQFDTAIEWYYSDTGNLAFATFFKKLKAFIKDEERTEIFAGQPFLVTRPYNDNENNALIRGYELSWYQTFDEFLPQSLAGFGIGANHTLNNSVSGEYDSEGDEIPFWGLSKHQTNINLFYEHNNFSANIAFNRRSGYTDSKVSHWTYETSGTVDTEQGMANSWNSLSVSLSYDITENLRITADGNNLLDPEKNITVNALKTELLAAGATQAQYNLRSASYGRRYSLGLRYKF